MAEGEKSVLLPEVRWAQRKETVSLSVSLQECQQPRIVLKPERLEFEAIGVGAKGLNAYGFTLDFYKAIDAESCVHKVTGCSVAIHLMKEGLGEWWPHLTLMKKSPHFLKLDFEKWKTESDDEENEKEPKDEKDINAFLENMREKKMEYEHKLKKSRDSYLVIYNATQLVAFAYIFFFCCINLIISGSEFVLHAYDLCGQVVHFAVMFSVMEVVHPMAGLTKGPWLTPLLQVCGRNFALFCFWLASDEIKQEWYVTGLFVTWSAIELVRYPTYILQIIGKSVPFVTWLCYTAWIPLYPLGALLEILIYINASWIFAERKMYELELPNALNFSIKFAWFIRVYVALFPLGLSVMFRHMWKLRCRKYGTRARKYKMP